MTLTFLECSMRRDRAFWLVTGAGHKAAALRNCGPRRIAPPVASCRLGVRSQPIQAAAC